MGWLTAPGEWVSLVTAPTVGAAPRRAPALTCTRASVRSSRTASSSLRGQHTVSRRAASAGSPPALRPLLPPRSAPAGGRYLVNTSG